MRRAGTGHGPAAGRAPSRAARRGASRVVGRAAGPTAGRLGLVSILASVVVACLPAAATTEGRAIGDLYTGFMLIAAVVAAVVIVPTVLAILRFRRRDLPAELPLQRRGHVGLEVTWTALPALVVIGLFVATLFVLTRVEATDAPSTTEVEVTGYRWGWTFAYPTEGVTVDGIGEPGPEIALPVGEPVTLRMTSADVIHSFYVPLFLFKRDANPGRETTFQFTIEEPGTYGGQCAEYCGTYHARMPFTVLAMERPAYDAWLASMRGEARAGGTGAAPSDEAR